MQIKTLSSNKLNSGAVLRLNNLQDQLRGGLAKKLNLTQWQEMLEQNSLIMIVGYDGDDIAGMAILRWHDLPGGRVGTLEDVVVDSSYRGNGYGEMLVARIVDIAKTHKVGIIDLTTHKDRKVANELYKKLGWEKRDTNIYRLYLSK